MKLLLDIGNTAVKWAEYSAGRMVSRGDFRHRDGVFSELADAAWARLQAPARIVVANVAGAVLQRSLSDWTRAHWGLQPDYFRATARACGVTNAYHVAADLGADRWAALVGAHRGHGVPVCIVDCGTALTVDVLSPAGAHLGGLILPGIAMLAECLVHNTADIGMVTDLPPLSLLAQGTGEGVTSGATRMAVAALDHVVGELVAGQGGNLEVVITGGDGARILPLLARPARLEPDLVLQGLAKLSGEH